MKNQNAMATWSINLNLNCPICGVWIDVIPIDTGSDEVSDFWELFSDNMSECLHQSKNIEVKCPECKHKFDIDCEY